MKTLYLVILFIFTDSVTSEPHKRVRSSPAEIPHGVRAKGLCRLLISELNTYPKWTDGQFMELMIICQPNVKARETPFKMTTFKVIFISHDGFLIGVCKLKGTSSYKKGNSGVYMAYTIGNKDVPNINMDNEECELPLETFRDHQAKHFPIGTEYPVAVGLIYNERETTLDDIQLVRTEENYAARKITPEMQKTMMRNLQDFYVYASAAPVSYCKYFANYYSHYDVNNNHVLRDWITHNMTELGLSRCGTVQPYASEKTWLPFQPELFAVAPTTPGQINLCDESVKFVIEDLQPRRKQPRIDEDTVADYSCYFISDDEAIDDVGTITTRAEFMEEFRRRKADVDRCRKLVSPPMDLSTLMDIDDPAINGVDTVEIPYAYEGNNTPFNQSEDKPYSEFESSLENEVPFIWNDCNEYSNKPQVVEAIRGNNPWLFFRDVIDKLICFWLEILEASKLVRCRLCHKLLEQKILVDRPGSDLVTKIMLQGQGSNDTKDKVKSRNSVNIRRHLENPLHEISLEYFKLFDAGKRGNDLRTAFERKGGVYRKFLNATENVIATAFQAVRLGISFFSYGILIETLKFHGTDLGHLYGNPTGMKTVLVSISDVMHADYLNSLKTNDPALTIMIDTSSDVASLPSMAVIFTTYDGQHSISTKLYKLLELNAGESAEGLFKVFMDSIKEDNIQDFVQRRCVGFTSDGGSNVLKFRKLLDQYTDHELITNHCVGHRLELVTQHAWDHCNYLSVIDKTINQLYRMFNSRSPKKKQLMKLAILELNDKEFEFKKIRRIRWVSHKLRASETILDHWPTVVRTLENAINDKTITLQSRQEAREILKLLKDGTFLVTLAFVVDVSRKLADLSRAAQTKGISLITKRERRDILITELTAYKLWDGKRVQELLRNSTFSDSRQTNLTVRDFETGCIEYKGVLLENPDGIYSDDRLYSKRNEYIDLLLTQLEIYFPNDPTDTFQIFDPKLWNASELNIYGARRLLEANDRLKWNFNEQSLSAEWTALKQSVFKHPEYMIRRLGNPEEFWSYYLNLSSIHWGSSIQSVISSIITVPMCSAEVERVYSLYTATKTNRRWSLKVGTIDAIIRIKFNGPKSLAELDTLALARGFLEKHSRADDKTRKRSVVLDKGDLAVIEEFDNENDPGPDED